MNRERTLRTWNRISLIVCSLLFSGSLFAAQITGTATNGTTNKPAAGDDVVLLSLAGGMDEVGRTKTDGPSDYAAVNKIQAGYKVTPLSDWGKTPKPVEVKIDPSIDMKTPPKIQVDNMPAGKYFAYAAELLKVQPPHLTDEPIIPRMERIGIEPGKALTSTTSPRR